MSGASITVNVEEFSRSLTGVTSIVPTRSTIPILSNVAISQKSGTVRLVATNLDMEIRLPVAPAAFDGEFCATVEGKRLADIFRNLSKGAQAKLTQSDNGRVIVTSGRSRFTLPSLPIADFPEMKQPVDVKTLRLPVTLMREEWARVSFAMSTEETRYYLCGIFMHADADSDVGGIKFVTTDGLRFAIVENIASEGEPQSDIPAVIIPSALVHALIKLWDAAADDIWVDIAVAKDRLLFRFGDWQVTGKTVDGSYPDYQRIIPLEYEKSATVDCEHLQKAMRRILLVSTAKTAAAKFHFTSDKLTVSVTDPDGGEAIEEIAAEYKGDDFEIGMNAKYVIDTAGAVPGGTARLSMNGPSDVVRWDSIISDSGFGGLISPIRLK